MATDRGTTTKSRAVDVRTVSADLLPYVRSRVIHYVNEADDLSAEIHQTSKKDARLVFYHGTKFDEEWKRESEVGDTETSTGNTILVKNIPQCVDEDILELFFESGKKVGAGSVKSVRLNEQKNWAIIEFCKPGAVDVVMSKKPLTLLDSTLDIHPYAPLLQGDESVNSLEIRGLPSELTQDILSLQTEGILGSSTASNTDEAVGSDDSGITIPAIEETISDLKPVQLKMLSVTKFPMTEEQKCPNVKVEIDHSKNEIVLTTKSDREDIKNIKLNMFETLSKLCTVINNIPESHAELFRAKQAQKYIASKLEKKKLVCTWEVRDTELVICSSEADIALCETVIKKSIREDIIPASNDSISILYSQEWPYQLKYFHKENSFIYKVDEFHTSIRIISTDDISTEVVILVNEFLKKYARIQTERFSNVSSSRQLQEVFRQYPNLILEKAREIENDLSMHYVSIQIAFHIAISGTLEGITLAKKRFRSLSIIL